MVNFIEGGVTAPAGFQAAGVHCGIRKNRSKKDLGLIVSDRPASAAAVYTRNLVKGAPLTVTAAHLADGTARAVVCNSGIANTCAFDGIEKAEGMCRLTAQTLGLQEEDVLVASTGVIGPSIDLAPIEAGMPALAAALSADGSGDAAEAIMTTDTRKKECAVTFTAGGKTCTLGGIAKGSGMIAPNMATMLCFLTTDAAIAPALLHEALTAVTDDTFNMMTVDGDTSTNDMVIILANGAAGGAMMTRAVAGSALFKAALFGADANWGRVLCAIGYSGAAVDVKAVDLDFASAAGRIAVCRGGAGIPVDEEKAKAILSEPEIVVDITLHDGTAEAVAWGCDLTYDYVKINGDYRS